MENMQPTTATPHLTALQSSIDILSSKVIRGPRGRTRKVLGTSYGVACSTHKSSYPISEVSMHVSRKPQLPGLNISINQQSNPLIQKSVTPEYASIS